MAWTVVYEDASKKRYGKPLHLLNAFITSFWFFLLAWVIHGVIEAVILGPNKAVDRALGLSVNRAPEALVALAWLAYSLKNLGNPSIIVCEEGLVVNREANANFLNVVFEGINGGFFKKTSAEWKQINYAGIEAEGDKFGRTKRPLTFSKVTSELGYWTVYLRTTKGNFARVTEDPETIKQLRLAFAKNKGENFVEWI